MADALVLGTSGQPCRFKSCYPHAKSPENQGSFLNENNECYFLNAAPYVIGIQYACCMVDEGSIVTKLVEATNPRDFEECCLPLR